MKIKNLIIFCPFILLAGCASQGEFNHLNATDVNLNSNNYRIIKAGASGCSTGFNLLGFIPFASPHYSEAKADLYHSVTEPMNGRAIALANQTEDRSTIYLILFSLPKVTITADVIEFTGTNSMTK
jgi:hypothetical protein